MLGIELDTEVMRSASCTGSGVLQEKNQRLGDTLNARNFALAEQSGLPLMTICSTFPRKDCNTRVRWSLDTCCGLL